MATRTRPSFKPTSLELIVWIQELKQRTKCKKCGRVGHWHRECPESSKENATHFLEVEIEEGDDALFCYALDVEPNQTSDQEQDTMEIPTNQIVEPDYHQFSFPDRLTTTSEGLIVTDEGPVELRPLADVCMVFQDGTCATIDTGCQRTAVGLDTLKHMMRHWSRELRWFKQHDVNRFRSVHGTSETRHNAIVPCGLGDKGCYLKPAVFEGEHSRNAPFLMSLQFLKHCSAVIHLEDY